MVDVAEHRDDRRTRRHHLGLVFFLLDRDFFAGLFHDRVESEALRDSMATSLEMFWLIVAIVPILISSVMTSARRNDHRGCELLHGQHIGDFDRVQRANERGERIHPSFSG